MEKTRKSSYDAAFNLKAIDLPVLDKNIAAARKLGVNKSVLWRWRRQREKLIQCRKTTNAFQGHRSRWLKLENVLEDWANTWGVDGRGVNTVHIRLKSYPSLNMQEAGYFPFVPQGLLDSSFQFGWCYMGTMSEWLALD